MYAIKLAHMHNCSFEEGYNWLLMICRNAFPKDYNTSTIRYIPGVSCHLGTTTLCSIDRACEALYQIKHYQLCGQYHGNTSTCAAHYRIKRCCRAEHGQANYEHHTSVRAGTL